MEPTVTEDIVPEPMESVSAPVIEKWPATVVVRRQPPRRAQPAPAPPPIPPPIPPVPPTVEELREEPHPHSVDIPMETEPLSVDIPGFEEFGPVPMDVDVSESTEKPLPSTILTNGTSDHFPRSPIPPDESISVGFARRSGRLREPPEKKTPAKPVTKMKVNNSIQIFSKTHFNAFFEVRVPLEDKALHNEMHTLPYPFPLAPPVPTPTKSVIKRVKLIVRRPPPPLTDPRQKAPPPKFGLSLNKFLHSYTRIDEDRDTNAATLERKSQAEAEIREKVVKFKAEGRFIPGTQALFGTMPHEAPYTSPNRTTKDIWDAVVETVVVRARMMPKKPIGRQVAAQIASKVQAYFDGLETKKLKAKEVEERRLRNLAKSTMKLVISEWKKAVYVSCLLPSLGFFMMLTRI